MDDGNLIKDKIVEGKIKIQLDCLNSTSEKINLLENEINEKRNLYRTTLSESTRRLNLIAHNLGDCISKSRPFYDAKKLAKEAQNKIQQAALDYDRAVSCHSAAREMVSVAEHGMHSSPSNTAWVEMLNHANKKVNEAEKDKFKRGLEHKRRALDFKEAEDKVNQLQVSLKPYIKKSRPYFELKRDSQEKLDQIIQSVKKAEARALILKETYSEALRNLEQISNSLHAQKKAQFEEKQRQLLGKRQEGVGAESQPIEESEQTDIESVDYQFIVEDLKRVDSIGDFDVLTTGSTSADETTSASTGTSPNSKIRYLSKKSSRVEKPNTSSISDIEKDRQRSFTESTQDLVTLTSLFDINSTDSNYSSSKMHSREKRMKKLKPPRYSRSPEIVSSASEYEDTE